MTRIRGFGISVISVSALSARFIRVIRVVMEDLLTKLGVDWRLLIAQVVNFLILFFILRKFLYRPVLTYLSERRIRISDGIRDAERASERLRGIELERQEVLRRAEAERRSVLEAASAEAEVVRKQRLEAASAEAAAIVEKSRMEIVRAKDDFIMSARQELAGLVVAATRKVVAGAVTPTVHQEIIDQAIAELEHSRKT